MPAAPTRNLIGIVQMTNPVEQTGSHACDDMVEQFDFQKLTGADLIAGHFDAGLAGRGVSCQIATRFTPKSVCGCIREISNALKLKKENAVAFENSHSRPFHFKINMKGVWHPAWSSNQHAGWSRTSRTLLASRVGVNGFSRNQMPGSSTPCSAKASSV